MNMPQELRDLAERLETAINAVSVVDALVSLERVINAAESVGATASGSWLGYQSHVYYENFSLPPSGAYFSQEWGFEHPFSGGTEGEWVEYRDSQVNDEIIKRSGVQDISKIKALISGLAPVIDRSRADISSILQIALSKYSDDFLGGLAKESAEIGAVTPLQIANTMHGGGSLISRDMRAISGKSVAPPHAMMIAEMISNRSLVNAGATFGGDRNQGGQSSRKAQ